MIKNSGEKMPEMTKEEQEMIINIIKNLWKQKQTRSKIRGMKNIY